MAASARWSSWVWGTRGSDLATSSNTLPEHHSALALLQLLDYNWFEDNLLKSRVGLLDAFLPLPASRPPYQSIELTDAAHSKWGASLSSQHPRSGKMPCARFETVSSSLILCKIPDSADALEWLHRPLPCAPALVSQQRVCSRPHADTILTPPSALLARFAKDLRNLKGLEGSENFQAWNVKSTDHGKQLRVVPMDGHLLQPTLRLLDTNRVQRNSSKSMTACEFDEFRGFMNLGFHLNQDMRTFPALRNRLEEASGSNKSPRAVLSTEPIQRSVATWLVRQSSTPLHQWQISATREDMKEHLKFWARAVATTVRQEC